jgi:hypothetical protein
MITDETWTETELKMAGFRFIHVGLGRLSTCDSTTVLLTILAEQDPKGSDLIALLKEFLSTNRSPSHDDWPRRMRDRLNIRFNLPIECFARMDGLALCNSVGRDMICLVHCSR